MAKFTPNEWEIIVHRLQMPDAIIESLTDHAPGEDPATYYGPIAIEDAIYMLDLNGFTRKTFSEIELIVLRECCEGSTYFAGIDDAVALGEMTQGQATAYQRAANRLQMRFNVVIPRA